jgi:hypothetical protein
MFVRFNLSRQQIAWSPGEQSGAPPINNLKLILYISMCQGRAEVLRKQLRHRKMGRFARANKFQRYRSPTLGPASQQVDIILITALSWNFLNKTALFVGWGLAKYSAGNSPDCQKGRYSLDFSPVREILLMSTRKCGIMLLRLTMQRFYAIRGA